GLRPRLEVLGAALLFSTGGAAIKGCQLSAWQVASFRCAVAGLFFWALLPAVRRGGLSGRVWLVGLAYASTLTAYVQSNKATTAANAIFLQSASPLYLLLLAPLLLRERVRRSDLLVMVTMAIGLALCFGGPQPPSETAPDPAAGNLWGLAAGLAWALTVLGLRWLAGGGDASDAPRAVVCGNVLGALVALPFALPEGAASLEGARLADGAWILYLGVVQIGLAYLLLTRGVREVPAFEASLLLLVEPVLSPIWTWWLHGETPGAGTFSGGALILAATVWRAWLAGRPDGDSGRP
ncbi:MAG: DMT family transporter, partial [Acidobacteriota bacterium]